MRESAEPDKRRTILSPPVKIVVRLTNSGKNLRLNPVPSSIFWPTVIYLDIQGYLVFLVSASDVYDLHYRDLAIRSISIS